MLVDIRDERLAAVARPEKTSHTSNILKSRQSDVICFRCGDPNHLTRYCMQHSSVRHWKERSSIRCHLCNKTGHLMKNCPRNGNGGERLAPLSPHLD